MKPEVVTKRKNDHADHLACLYACDDYCLVVGVEDEMAAQSIVIMTTHDFDSLDPVNIYSVERVRCRLAQKGSSGKSFIIVDDPKGDHVYIFSLTDSMFGHWRSKVFENVCCFREGFGDPFTLGLEQNEDDDYDNDDGDDREYKREGVDKLVDVLKKNDGK